MRQQTLWRRKILEINPGVVQNFGQTINNYRKKNDGSELMPDEALSRSQAINAMSFKAAKSIGLVPHGLYINSEANFTICSGDPFAEETEVLETWIAGKPVWRKPKTIRY